jgi:hypothetical protein
MPWISDRAPLAPQVAITSRKAETIRFTVKPAKENRTAIKYFVLYRFPAGRSLASLVNSGEYIHSILVKPQGFEQELSLVEGNVRYQYYVSAVAKSNTESELVPVTALVKD